MDDLISEFSLRPHPEGGYFRETYRAKAAAGARSACTAIYYLLPQGQRSRLHRLDADELWHFYRGDPLLIIELQEGGPARRSQLSSARPQHLVPAGTWFGAVPAADSAYSLVGCTVAPGFEFTHFELGDRSALLAQFPLAAESIHLLT